MNKNIYYLYNEFENKWFKVEWSAEESHLSDICFFLDDGPRHRKGGRITFDYGCMSKLIEMGSMLPIEKIHPIG